MSTVAATEVAHDRESWTREYWLSHCEGYRVETPDGLIGFVEEVVRPPDASEASSIKVRAGLGGRSVVVVPAAAVREIVPDAERIVIESRG